MSSNHDAHEGPKKNNALNTVGIITVGIVGSVFVYVSIIALQALYVSETAPVATVKSFGAQGEVRSSLKAEQVGNISEPRTAAVYGPANTQLYHIGIDAAKALIIRDSREPARLVPAIAPSEKPTIAPAFGRPQPLPPPPPPPADPILDPATGLPVDPAAAPAAGTPAPAAGTPAPAAGTPAPAAGTPAPAAGAPAAGTSAAGAPAPAAGTPAPAAPAPAPAAPTR